MKFKSDLCWSPHEPVFLLQSTNPAMRASIRSRLTRQMAARSIRCRLSPEAPAFNQSSRTAAAGSRISSAGFCAAVSARGGNSERVSVWADHAAFHARMHDERIIVPRACIRSCPRPDRRSRLASRSPRPRNSLRIHVPPLKASLLRKPRSAIN